MKHFNWFSVLVILFAFASQAYAAGEYDGGEAVGYVSSDSGSDSEEYFSIEEEEEGSDDSYDSDDSGFAGMHERARKAREASNAQEAAEAAEAARKAAEEAAMTPEAARAAALAEALAENGLAPDELYPPVASVRDMSPEQRAASVVQQSHLDFTNPAVLAALASFAHSGVGLGAGTSAAGTVRPTTPVFEDYLQSHQAIQLSAGWGGGASAGAGCSSRHVTVVSPSIEPPAEEVMPFYSAEELEELPNFAHAIFQSTAEANFCSNNGKVLYEGLTAENSYFYHRLHKKSSNKFNKKNISVEALLEQFRAYNDHIQADHRASEKWLSGEKTTFFTAADEREALDDSFKYTVEKARSAGINEERTDAFVEKKIIKNSRDEAAKIVLFMGDIHGSVHALLRNLLAMMQLGYIRADFTLADNVHLVFLGDLVDRGLQGIESIYTVLRLKNASWDQVHIVRGNHESGWLIADYGFAYELSYKYLREVDFRNLYFRYAQFCSSLPSAIFLGVADGDQMRFMQCCHGGLAPEHDLTPLLSGEDASFEKIPYTPTGRGYEWHDACCTEDAKQLSIQDAYPSSWPEGSVAWKKSERGSSKIFQFHRDDITKMLSGKKLFMLMRGHQDLGAPCKVLFDGQADPISWRAHPAFTGNGITPASFFRQGIKLPAAPNCMTLSTATEARELDHEGFLAIQFNETLAASRLWVYEVTLADKTKQPLPDGFYVRYKVLSASAGGASAGAGESVAAGTGTEQVCAALTGSDGTMKKPFDWIRYSGLPAQLPLMPGLTRPIRIVAERPYAPAGDALKFFFRQASVADAMGASAGGAHGK